MISFNLQIFLIIITIIYFIIVLKAIKKDVFPIKNSALWLFFGVIMLICIFNQSLLIFICEIIGIATVSNFLLLCGFMALLILSFDLYKMNNKLKKDITNLGQKLAILEKEIKK